MKKLLSIVLALVLVFALCAMPASAETNAKEWAKGTGPAKINFSDDGAKISIDAGVNLYYYQKQVNIRDFTVKFKVNAPDYTDQGCYAALTIGGNGKYTGAQGAQAFIVMWIRDDHLCIDPQILHNGKAIRGSYRFFLDMATEDVVVHGEKVDDITYRLTFNETQTYEFEIPENFNFVEDRNGEGALGFGGSIGMSQSESSTFGDWNILVKEINGVKMNGKDEPVSSNTSTGGTTGGSDSTVDPDTGINTGVIGGGDVTADTNNATDATTEEGNNTLLIVIIICGAVLLLAVVAMVIIIVLKKKPAAVEEVAEEAEEPAEEE